MSALDKVNIQRLLMYIQNTLGNTLNKVIDHPNDALTRRMITNIATQYFDELRARRVVYDYAVVCNEENNPPSIINNNIFVCDVLVKPAHALVVFEINFIMNSSTLVLDSSILTKEETYEAYERAMALIGER